MLEGRTRLYVPHHFLLTKHPPLSSSLQRELRWKRVCSPESRESISKRRISLAAVRWDWRRGMLFRSRACPKVQKCIELRPVGLVGIAYGKI
jgi:hypothetical protein